MIKNLTKRDLRNLDDRDYMVVCTVSYAVTVSHKLPFYTGADGIFPKYLTGYEDYYVKRSSQWRIMPEFTFCRPYYTLTVHQKLYNIVLTNSGKEKVKQRLEYHQRLANEYKKLLEE